MLRRHFIKPQNTEYRTQNTDERLPVSDLSVFPLLLLVFSLFISTSTADNRQIDTKGPIVITSSTMTSDNKARTALFEGSVVTKSDTMTIYSDKMLVYYSEGGNITRIDANGHVRLIRSERVITSDAATYFADEDKVVFTGEPRAVEGGNVVSGSKMIYLMKEDRSIVENSKVFIENRKDR